jgi:hypothetical protein
MKLVKPAIFFLALFAAVNSFGQPTKIVLSKDQKFKVETTTKVNTTAEVMGQSMETTADNKTTTLMEVTDIDKDEIKFKSTITQMVVNTSAMGQEMSFDSDKNDNSGPMADMLSPKINKAKKIVIDPKGNVIKQEGDETDEEQLAMMGLQGGNDAVIELYVAELIGRELKAGDVVPALVTITKEKLNIRDSGSYTVTSVENDVASLSYSGTQVMTTTLEQMGMEMQMNSNNTVKTELQMDINTGLVLVRATVLDMNGTVDAGGMQIPITGKTITTAKITLLQ